MKVKFEIRSIAINIPFIWDMRKKCNKIIADSFIDIDEEYIKSFYFVRNVPLSRAEKFVKLITDYDVIMGNECKLILSSSAISITYYRNRLLTNKHLDMWGIA